MWWQCLDSYRPEKPLKSQTSRPRVCASSSRCAIVCQRLSSELPSGHCVIHCCMILRVFPVSSDAATLTTLDRGYCFWNANDDSDHSTNCQELRCPQGTRETAKCIYPPTEALVGISSHIHLRTHVGIHRLEASTPNAFPSLERKDPHGRPSRAPHAITLEAMHEHDNLLLDALLDPQVETQIRLDIFPMHIVQDGVAVR
jgi:hypothetical protein